METKLTVFFEEPFWVGVCEVTEGETLRAARIVFGAEPRDYEVYAYVLENWYKLRFSPGVKSERQTEYRVSPKRLQRISHAQTEEKGIGTKAQQALKLQHELSKKDSKQNAKEKREEKEQRLFELKQLKKKEKHKGR